MSALEGFLLLLHVGVAIAICGFVLLQHGKGADMGAAFGSGSSGSLFGASGSANFLSRTTAVLAALFFVATLALAMLGHRSVEAPTSVMDKAPAAPAQAGEGGAPKPPSDVPPAGTGSAAPASGGTAPGTTAPDAGQATPKNGAANDVPK